MKKIAFALSLLGLVAVIAPSCSKNDEHKCTCTVKDYPTSTGVVDTTIVYNYPKGSDKSASEATCTQQDAAMKILDASNSCVFD